MRAIFLLLISFVLSSSVFAQKQKADSVYALPVIQVTALRMPVAGTHAPVHVSSIDNEAIKATFSRNLAELLDRAGSPFVRQYGTGLATLSFRGTSSSQSLILLDGIPFSDPQLGQIDLSLLPSTIIDEVHILHGPGSALYGSQSIGGVINLETQQNTAPFFLNTSGFAGPYDERQGQIIVGIKKGSIKKSGSKKGSLSGIASLSHGYEQGDFPYLNPSLFPPASSRREGADRSQSSAFGKISLNREASSTTVSGWHSDTERGIPGTATTTPVNERQWDTNSRILARHIRSSKAGVLSFTGALQKNRLRYRNPQIAIDQTSRTSVATLEAEVSKLNIPFPLSTGFASSFYTASHPSLSSSAKESRLGLFVNSNLMNKRGGIFPALRIDTFIPSEGKQLTAISPSIGVNAQILQMLPLRIKASAGRAFRAPTFNDRFWQPGGNPDLKSEVGWNYEAGAIYTQSHDRSTYSIEAASFLQRIKNQIIWLPDASSGNRNIWSPKNIGTTRSAGVEMAATASRIISPKTSLGAQITYTLVDAKDISDKSESSYNQPLRYTPKHVLKSRFSLVQQTGEMRWNFDISIRHISRRYITTDGSQSLKPYTTADAHLRVTRSLNLTTFTAGVFLENITNQAYEVVKGYPVPPRLLRIQLSIGFAGKE
ncbi:MAG: TonB-dependent receptor plug domain-containing protein [Rhodothermales bacterium]